jgi:hypothetical protein
MELDETCNFIKYGNKQNNFPILNTVTTIKNWS